MNAWPNSKLNMQESKKESQNVMRFVSIANQNIIHLRYLAQPVFRGTSKEGKGAKSHVKRLANTMSQSIAHQSIRSQPVFGHSSTEGKEDSTIV